MLLVVSQSSKMLKELLSLAISHWLLDSPALVALHETNVHYIHVFLLLG